jgi:cytidine deaminase
MDDETLIKAAITARDKAYAPYSNFKVGAAVLDETGEVHTGQNVENAAYPNGICAETAAIAMMVQQGGTRIVKIAVSGGSGDMLCTPCGGCRQRIREFANAGTPVIIADNTQLKARFTLDELLPHSFGPENLDQD